MYMQDYATLLVPTDRTPGIEKIYANVREYVRKSGITVNFNGMVITTSADFKKYWLQRVEREYGKDIADQMAVLAQKCQTSQEFDVFGILNDIIGSELSLPSKFQYNQIKSRLAPVKHHFHVQPFGQLC